MTYSGHNSKPNDPYIKHLLANINDNLNLSAQSTDHGISGINPQLVVHYTPGSSPPPHALKSCNAHIAVHYPLLNTCQLLDTN